MCNIYALPSKYYAMFFFLFFHCLLAFVPHPKQVQHQLVFVEVLQSEKGYSYQTNKMIRNMITMFCDSKVSTFYYKGFIKQWLFLRGPQFASGWKIAPTSVSLRWKGNFLTDIKYIYKEGRDKTKISQKLQLLSPNSIIVNNSK